ncbi:MAG: hypothetical protein KIT25_19910 [Enhydrobacter sp.]|nr:MAG: hypothetical protein KIT25_19910 [Enhydrobacter sp.]
MRYGKWILMACLLAVTAGCMQTAGYPYGGYRGGNQWNSASRDYDRDGIPNRYDRDANGDGVPDRYQRR